MMGREELQGHVFVFVVVMTYAVPPESKTGHLEVKMTMPSPGVATRQAPSESRPARGFPESQNTRIHVGTGKKGCSDDYWSSSSRRYCSAFSASNPKARCAISRSRPTIGLL